MSSLSVASPSTPHPPRPKIPNPSSSTLSLFPSSRRTFPSANLTCNASSTDTGKARGKGAKERTEDEGWVEVEEDLPWIQDKAMDFVEFTGSITQALPGPRVARTSIPWILALPLAYAGVTLAIAIVKSIRKLSSPAHARRKLVSKNALVCRTIDEILQKNPDSFDPAHFSNLEKQTGFSIEAILRKYTRYALNEKPFNPNLISNLINLRAASLLPDSSITNILIEISSRIVFDKGPVVMDMSKYTEKGFKRKLAVQVLFGKVLYLSELPEFCSKDNSWVIKEIFGVTDEEADQLRLHTLPEDGDVDSLEKMAATSDSERES